MNVKRIGFTGTQKGMTLTQQQKVGILIDLFKPDEVHHGDCVGADSHFHNICKKRNILTILHPPNVARKRAFCKGGFVLEEKPYLERNHDIVDNCDLLIATPDSDEIKRSGTWATIRYANKVGRDVIIVRGKNGQ